MIILKIFFRTHFLAAFPHKANPSFALLSEIFGNLFQKISVLRRRSSFRGGSGARIKRHAPRNALIQNDFVAAAGAWRRHFVAVAHNAISIFGNNFQKCSAVIILEMDSISMRIIRENSLQHVVYM
jgi:hypothetical protein